MDLSQIEESPDIKARKLLNEFCSEIDREEFVYILATDDELRNAMSIDMLDDEIPCKECLVTIWNTIMAIDAGVDTNINPDVRKEFLIQAGIPECKIDEFITTNDYIKYQTQKIKYLQIAKQMEQNIAIIRSKDKDSETKLTAALDIKKTLQKCVLYPNLKSLTSIYKDKKADNVLGYDTKAISEFVARMLIEYGKYEETSFVFDIRDKRHMKALKELVIQLNEDTSNLPDGVSLRRKMNKATGESILNMYVGETFIISYKTVGSRHSYTINDDYDILDRTIYAVPALMKRLYRIINGLDYYDWNFDVYNEQHLKALKDLVIQLSDGKISPPNGVSLRRETDDETGEPVWKVYVKETFIISYIPVDDSYSYRVNDDYGAINKAIHSVPALMEQLRDIINNS